jgi:hypothetical protein
MLLEVLLEMPKKEKDEKIRKHQLIVDGQLRFLPTPENF